MTRDTSKTMNGPSSENGLHTKARKQINNKMIFQHKNEAMFLQQKIRKM